jgi:hypothetical protein
MPNWCYNNVKIGFEPEQEQTLRDALDENKDLFEQFLPRPADQEENWYDWNVSNWGTKWDAKPYDINWDDGCVTFRLETAWGPPIGFYDRMSSLNYNVLAYYLEEGMAFVGCYDDGFDDSYNYGDMSADEMDEQLPSWAEEEFNLITMQRDSEDEEDEEENEYIPNQYNDDEKTVWFDVTVKPVHNGMYEVKTKEWPFPHVMDWNGKFWCMSETNSKSQSKVEVWRGLNFDANEQNKLIEGLNNIQKELLERLGE